MTSSTGEPGLAGPVRGMLSGMPGVGALFDEPLSRHCSMGIGGPADAFVSVDGVEALRSVLAACAENGVRRIMIGQGTNIIPADDGFRGVVVKLAGEFGTVRVEGRDIVAGAAARLSSLLEAGRAAGLGGLEFTTGIPGCVGGSLPGNAGTASESLGDLVVTVRALSETGEVRDIDRADLGFAYRRSGLRELGVVITEARFRLSPCEGAVSLARIREFAARRKEQPLNLPNAGCVFKNPPGESAGRLLDEAGLKGARAGRVEISRVHANFMVNLGGGTAANVAELVSRAREAVRERSGVTLEMEVSLLDETGSALSC